jgi:hypothetical protein
VQFVGEADRATGASQKLALTIKSIADAVAAMAQNPTEALQTLKTIAEVIAAVLVTRLAVAIGAVVTSAGGLLAALQRLVLVATVFAAIRLYDTAKSITAARDEADKLAQATARGKVEADLLARAYGEINATGVVSAKTQLELAALAATRLKDEIGPAGEALKKVGDVATLVGGNIKSALQDEVKRAGGTIKDLEGAYRQTNDAIKAGLSERLAAIESSYQAQTRAAQNAGQSERDKIASTTQLLINAERDKTEAIRSAGEESLRAWEASYGAAKSLASEAAKAQIDAAKEAAGGQGDAAKSGAQAVLDAQRAGADAAREIDRRALSDKISLYEQIASAYRSTTDKLIAEEQRLLDAARRANDQRKELAMSTEDRIRELGRKGVDQGAVYADRLKEIDEKNSKAKQALANGDFEQAKKLADQAVSLAERSVGEITRTTVEGGKERTRVLATENQTAATAIGKIKESAGIADEALKGMAQTFISSSTAVKTGANESAAALEKVTAELKNMKQSLAEQGKLSIGINTADAEEGIKKLKDLAAAQELVAQLKLDTVAATDSLNQLKTDAGNLQLIAKVEADTAKVAADIDALKSQVSGAGLTLPVVVQLDQPRAAIGEFVNNARAAMQQPTAATHTVNVNASAAISAINQLQQPTSSVHTVRVQKVQANAAGGFIERLAAGGQALGALGTLASAAYTRAAGRISGAGGGTSDTVPALLSPGEYVIKTDSVRRFGANFFAHLNAGLMPPALRYAAGGAVALPTLGAQGSEAGNGQRDSIDVRLHLGAQSYPLQSSRATAQALAGALRDLSRGA